jgi:hypothetical protein
VIAALLLAIHVPVADADDALPATEAPALEGVPEPASPDGEPPVLMDAGPAASDDRFEEMPLQPLVRTARFGTAPNDRCCLSRDACGWPLDACGKRVGSWRFNLEAAASLMPAPEGVLGATPPAGFTSLDWGRNDYGIAIGGRLTVGYRMAPRDEIEARVTVLGQWDDSSRQTGSFGFTNVTGNSPVAAATLTSEAELQSYEGMWWRELCCTGTTTTHVGAGLRYVHFEERARARDWAGLAPTSRLDGTSHNELFAAQLGGAVRFRPATKWEFTVSGKALVGLMARELIVDEDAILSGGVKQAVDNDTTLGYGLELELHGTYRWSSCISLTAGYTGLFLGEVVRAHEMFDFSRGVTGAVQALQRSESLVVHSVFLGIEWQN